MCRGIFDAIPKYVASRGAPEPGWRDAHLLGSDLVAELSALRERHREIHVIGSIDFTRTLVAHGLGHGRFELMKFNSSPAQGGIRNAPPNTECCARQLGDYLS